MCVSDWKTEYRLHVERREKERTSQFDKFYFDIVCRTMRNAKAEQKPELMKAA